jgi:hypothetical protein
MNKTTMTQTVTIKNPYDFWKEDWFKEWERLAYRDYHHRSSSQWECYENQDFYLIYEYRNK